MKITRLKLVNWIGIKHGLDRDEIEIDFSKNPEKVIMLLGGNGSGKSTIMSACHPLKIASGDDRKNVILPGCEGRKEIDIVHKGSLYEIVHIYGKGGKGSQSFIKKDGVELNDSGLVTQFDEIAEKEFGITKEYFEMGRIGSNTKSFVDKTTAERKSYITTFLNIDDIKEKYDIVKKRLAAIQGEIDNVGNNLGQYRPIDELQASLDVISTDLQTLNSEVMKLSEEKGVAMSDVQHADKDLTSYRSKEELEACISEKNDAINSSTALMSSIEGSVSDIKDKTDDDLSKLDQEIRELEAAVKVVKSKIEGQVIIQKETENEIARIERELEGLGKPEDIEFYAKTIEEATAKKERLTASLKANPAGQLLWALRKAGRVDIDSMLEKLRNFTDFIEKYYTDLVAKTFSVDTTNLEEFMKDDFKTILDTFSANIRTTLESKRSQLEAKKTARGGLEQHVCQLDNLKKRPAACTIDECPFIREALLHKNVFNELSACDIEIESINVDIARLESSAENLSRLITIYSNFKVLYDTLGPRTNELYVDFIKGSSLLDMVEAGLAQFQEKRQTFFDNVTSAKDDLQGFEECIQTIRKAEADKKECENTEVKAKHQEDLSRALAHKEKIETEIAALNEEKTAKEAELTAKETLASNIRDYFSARSKLNSNKTMLSSATTDLKKVVELVAAKLTAESKLNEIQAKLSLTEEKRDAAMSTKNSLEADLINAKKLSARAASLQTEKAPVSLISDILNPNKGIPLIFTQTYLNETEAIANELLDIAYHGEFKVKFVTNEKEFKIQVVAKNNQKDDIKLASQGEIALTTISISLALIQQMIGDYNILCLDEIDGPLDKGNRASFIDILMTQTDRLGIEQVFVISHNDVFDTVPAGLVLLPGNSVDQTDANYMKDKVVLFDSSK